MGRTKRQQRSIIAAQYSVFWRQINLTRSTRMDTLSLTAGHEGAHGICLILNDKSPEVFCSMTIEPNNNNLGTTISHAYVAFADWTIRQLRTALRTTMAGRAAEILLVGFCTGDQGDKVYGRQLAKEILTRTRRARTEQAIRREISNATFQAKKTLQANWTTWLKNNTTPNAPQGKARTFHQHQQQQQQSCESADEVDTADVARRVKAVLANNGISQRAFGEHILKMTSGCVSDLLTKPKPWVMLCYKGRESYTKMIAFLDDSDSVNRLKSDEQQRCAMNNALNALKAIADSAESPPLGGSQTQQSNGHLNALEALSIGLPLSASPCSPDSSPPPALSSQPNAANSALQLIAGLAFGELGSHTPIGALLKKTNSPNSPTTPNSVGTMKVFSGAVKQKGVPFSSGDAVSPSLSMVSLDKSDGLSVSQIGPLVPPAKKIPRFQRTIITDKQKEALLFIFAHEQRPNSRCIEQLALKLGLTPRTVTNWFHNYRTRQKAKEAKPLEIDESAVPTATALVNVPTPAQILARALNASDSKTTNWFRELAELLRLHSDASVDVDSIGGSRGSVGTASVASSSPSSSNGTTTVVAIQLMGDDGQIDTTTDGAEEEVTNGGRANEETDQTRETNLGFLLLVHF